MATYQFNQLIEWFRDQIADAEFARRHPVHPPDEPYFRGYKHALEKALRHIVTIQQENPNLPLMDA